MSKRKQICVYQSTGSIRTAVAVTREGKYFVTGVVLSSLPSNTCHICNMQTYEGHSSVNRKSRSSVQGHWGILWERMKKSIKVMLVTSMKFWNEWFSHSVCGGGEPGLLSLVKWTRRHIAVRSHNEGIKEKGEWGICDKCTILELALSTVSHVLFMNIKSWHVIMSNSVVILP